MNIIKQFNIIKRLRSKKFTTKRRPYKTYLNASSLWNDIFNKIANLKLDGITNFFIIISNKFSIILSTLKNKYYDFKNNKIIIDNKEYRGGFNKIFTLKQELNILAYLKNLNYTSYLKRL
jgi:hypothetical protein